MGPVLRHGYNEDFGVSCRARKGRSPPVSASALRGAVVERVLLSIGIWGQVKIALEMKRPVLELPVRDLCLCCFDEL